MSIGQVAARFCVVVEANPEITNATARIGAWLIGTAVKLGGFPVQLSLRQIQKGFSREGVTIEGTGCRMETIKASLEWLETSGYLHSEDSPAISGFGHHARLYTFRG